MEKPTNSDPRLKEAMQKIISVVKRYDIAGHIHLISQTHSEFFTELYPSWSCLEPMPHGVRIKSTLEKHGSVEKRNEVLADTVHMIVHLQRVSAGLSHAAFSILDRIEAAGIKIETIPHTGGGVH